MNKLQNRSLKVYCRGCSVDTKPVVLEKTKHSSFKVNLWRSLILEIFSCRSEFLFTLHAIFFHGKNEYEKKRLSCDFLPQIISNQASQIDIEIPSKKFHRTSLQILIYHLIPPAILFPGQTVNCSPISVNDILNVKIFRDGIGTFFYSSAWRFPLTFASWNCT